MGQYYRPLLIFEDGKEISALPHDFDNGYKLMEHSWIGNNFVNAVLYQIKDNPARVAWIGDYSDEPFDDGVSFSDGFITSNTDFHLKYESVWSNKVHDISSESPQVVLDIDHASGYYLVNMTKQCYIDMEKYVKENSMHDRFGDSETWCINPFPLLTCVGNGKGGGDYFGKVGIDDVGSWAFDKIYITYLRPGNMEEVMCFFKE